MFGYLIALILMSNQGYYLCQQEAADEGSASFEYYPQTGECVIDADQTSDCEVQELCNEPYSVSCDDEDYAECEVES